MAVTTRQVVGGWSAADYGLEIGKHLEYEIERLGTDRGGSFESVTFFKPYVIKSGQKAGQIGKAFGIPLTPSGVAALVDKINHLVMNYLPEGQRGTYVFQPAPQVIARPYGQPGLSQMGFRPAAPQPQFGGAPTPQYAQPQQPQHPGFSGYADGSLAQPPQQPQQFGGQAIAPMPQNYGNQGGVNWGK